MSGATDRHGQRVEIEGIYTAREVRPSSGGGAGQVVVVVSDDGREVMLEPFWHPDVVRPAEERARFEGRRVRVVGTYHREQPPQPGLPEGAVAASYGGACIHPVESVTPAPAAS